MTDEVTCKYCGADITPEWQKDPGWDGETCSLECEQDLNDIEVWEDWEDLYDGELVTEEPMDKEEY